LANNSGIAEAGQAISKINAFKGKSATGSMANIPRTHLVYKTDVWMGTSGDRVLSATDKNKGLAVAEVVPKWAFGQKVNLADHDAELTKKQVDKLYQNGFQLPGEGAKGFMERKAKGDVPVPPHKLVADDVVQKAKPHSDEAMMINCFGPMSRVRAN
jgi:hypothetical protein